MNTENLRGVCITGMPIGSVSYTGSSKVENTIPSAYRLAKKGVIRAISGGIFQLLNWRDER